MRAHTQTHLHTLLKWRIDFELTGLNGNWRLVFLLFSIQFHFDLILECVEQNTSAQCKTLHWRHWWWWWLCRRQSMQYHPVRKCHSHSTHQTTWSTELEKFFPFYNKWQQFKIQIATSNLHFCVCILWGDFSHFSAGHFIYRQTFFACRFSLVFKKYDCK